MPSYNNYRNDYLSRARMKSLSAQPKSMIKEKDIAEEKLENIRLWVSFYRKNIHRFIMEYMGINLFPYQIIWCYMMDVTDSFIAIASRASAKSWLIGTYAVARAILYPNSLIVIVASTREQAGLIISEKIKGLQDNYPNVAREIDNLVSSINNYSVSFKNGSTIRVVPARESGRGRRSNFTIYEEFRLIPRDVLDAIIRPFAVSRQPPYLQKKEYAHLIEEPKEVFISSSYYKNFWWYKEVLITLKNMIKGENVGVIFFDYLIAIKHGIKTIKQISREKSKMDESTFRMEYMNLPVGEGSGAYFKLNLFLKNRNIKKAFYPQSEMNYNSKKNPYHIERTNGEIRVVSVDVATRAGRENDLTIITCIRCLPTAKGYHREVLYIESHSGKNTIIQAKRIKQIFHDFDADTIVLDVLNAGIAILDSLGTVTRDDERGLEYDAMTIMNHPSIDESTYKELTERTIGLNAIPCIYPISGTAKLNSMVAVTMRNILQKKLISFLIAENEGDEYLSKTNKDYSQIDTDKAFYLNPYVQTSLMINESINLEMILSSGNIKLEEPNGGRKDRYSSLAYGNYYISLLDTELLREEGENDSDELLKVTGFY